MKDREYGVVIGGSVNFCLFLGKTLSFDTGYRLTMLQYVAKFNYQQTLEARRIPAKAIEVRRIPSNRRSGQISFHSTAWKKPPESRRTRTRLLSKNRKSLYSQSRIEGIETQVIPVEVGSYPGFYLASASCTAELGPGNLFWSNYRPRTVPGKKVTQPSGSLLFSSLDSLIQKRDSSSFYLHPIPPPPPFIPGFFDSPGVAFFSCRSEVPVIPFLISSPPPHSFVRHHGQGHQVLRVPGSMFNPQRLCLRCAWKLTDRFFYLILG